MERSKLRNLSPALFGRMSFKKSETLMLFVAAIGGVLCAAFMPEAAKQCGYLGDLFIKSLKLAAPFLIFSTVICAVAKPASSLSSKLKVLTEIFCVLLILASLISVLVCLLLPADIPVDSIPQKPNLSLSGSNLLLSFFARLVENPISALLSGNCLAVLVWGAIIGIALKRLTPNLIIYSERINKGLLALTLGVLKLLPLGIFGLICKFTSDLGLDVLVAYLPLIRNLLISILFMAVVVNPLVYFLLTGGKDPFPTLLKCFLFSGVNAFFSRSSIANIPVNLELSKRLGISKDFYSAAIPLGATLNMPGAAITLCSITMSAAVTLGSNLNLTQLAYITISCAFCGLAAAGIPSGALLLLPIPMSGLGLGFEECDYFISVGFLISIIQDSAATALNSFSDVFLISAVEKSWLGTSKEGRPVVDPSLKI